ncbi:MAG: hypothetical protein JW892_14315, partial [Anaerolineae bacterium]|nr:hypothetical protein [Anaerolineae bacterium]
TTSLCSCIAHMLVNLATIAALEKTTVEKPAKSLKKPSKSFSASVIFAGCARKNHKETTSLCSCIAHMLVNLATIAALEKKVVLG